MNKIAAIDQVYEDILMLNMAAFSARKLVRRLGAHKLSARH